MLSRLRNKKALHIMTAWRKLETRLKIQAWWSIIMQSAGFDQGCPCCPQLCKLLWLICAQYKTADVIYMMTLRHCANTACLARQKSTSQPAALASKSSRLTPVSLGIEGRFPDRARACWGLLCALALASCPNTLAEAAEELSSA